MTTTHSNKAVPSMLSVAPEEGKATDFEETPTLLVTQSIVTGSVAEEEAVEKK